MELIIKSPKYGEFTVYYDECDHNLISKYTWRIYLCKPKYQRKYAVSQMIRNGVWKNISIHRLIMDFPEKKEVDHIDLNGLNNRRSNLRVGTHSQNNMNKTLQTSNTTGYKGVYYYGSAKRVKKYWTYIWINKKRISGGYFEKKEDAARKYNELAVIHHKEFANLNIIIENG